MSVQVMCHNNDVLLQTQGPISPHCIVALPNSNGMQLLLCYDNEGVYVNTYGKVSLLLTSTYVIYFFIQIVTFSYSNCLHDYYSVKFF